MGTDVVLRNYWQEISVIRENARGNLARRYFVTS